MHRITRLLAIAVFIVIISACKDKAAPVAADVPEVKILTLAPQTLDVTSEFVGQTKGSVDAEVRARVDGIIFSEDYKEGSEVKEGDLLYTIDPGPFEVKLNEAKAKLIEAQTKLVKAEADLKRTKPLADMGAASQQELDLVVAQVGVAKGGVDVAQAQVDTANINLGYTKITAPISGLIGLSQAHVGEYVGKPPNAVVLNTISQLDPIKVRFTITENEYLMFMRQRLDADKAGQAPQKRVIQLILSDGTVYPENGELASVNSQVDTSTGALTVDAVFPNKLKLLRPGQFAKVRTTSEKIDNALVVPLKAVRQLQGLKQVLVIGADNKVEVKTVTVGLQQKDNVLIQSGLSAGDRVVVDPRLKISVGMEVIPVEVTQSQSAQD